MAFRQLSWSKYAYKYVIFIEKLPSALSSRPPASGGWGQRLRSLIASGGWELLSQTPAQTLSIENAWPCYCKKDIKLVPHVLLIVYRKEYRFLILIFFLLLS